MTVPLGPPPDPAATTTTRVGVTSPPTTTIVSSGPQVACLEARLVELGYAFVGTPDETYGPETVTAVQDFQTNRGLYPNGVATSLTLRQLGLRGDDPLSKPVRVTMIGDSTMAAMRWYDEVNNSTLRYDTLGSGYDTILSAESCRRLVRTSCTGRIDPATGTRWVPASVLPLMQTSLRGRLGDVLVVMAGYDDTDIVAAIDQIMTEANAQGVDDVFWLNYRLTNGYPQYQQYYTAHNQALLAARAKHPSLTVLDWDAYSIGRTSWFERDGVHLTGLGATELGRFVRAAVDGRRPADCRPPVAAQTMCRAVRLGAFPG